MRRAAQLTFEDSLSALSDAVPTARKAIERTRTLLEAGAAPEPTEFLEPAPPPAPASLLIPLLPGNFRALPHVALRSALFGVIQNGRRPVEKNKLIASTAGVEIRFSGERLDQLDLDVWEEVIHRACGRELPKGVRFGVREFLRSVGRKGGGGSDKEWLWECFRRLKQAQVCVTVVDGNGRRKASFMGSLLGSNVLEAEGCYFVQLNPEIVLLFGDGAWSKIEHAQRVRLGRDQLAKWLLGYYASHADPHPVKVSTLMNLCGSSTSAANLKVFRQKLRNALEKLQRNGTLAEWSIDEDDRVHVSTKPTASQRRHLARTTPPSLL